ncbi:MAG TPA: hypothetical protein VMQ58_02840 [Candidatus Saccharimonadales bacterium]|jgi:hypothetical protein|nr:hypothetical protein [Candidatus Saccharimonadales bacterium]
MVAESYFSEQNTTMELEPWEIIELQRPLTDGEMVKLINHEGMVTLEDPHDIETAQKLAVDGLLLVFKPGMLGNDSVDIVSKN